LKQRSLPPGDENGNQVTVNNNGYPGEYRPRESYDPGYVDTDYRTVDTEKDLREYIAIILRRKKTIILIALIVFILAGIYTFTLPRVYLTQATLELEKETGASLSNLGDMLSGGGGGGAEIFATQIGILKDRATAQALIARMNLSESPEFSPAPGLVSSAIAWVKSKVSEFLGAEPPGPPDPIIAREGLTNAVIGRISASRDKQSNLLIVGVEASSPKFAQEMLQNLIDIFLAQNLDKRRRVQREAGVWLKQELTTAQDKVIKSLAALMDFTTKHGMVGIDDSANHILAFFQKTAEGLVQSKQQRIQYQALEEMDGVNEAAAMSGVKTPDLDQLTGKLSVLESEHAQMSEIYSESYPKLILLRKQIDFIKNRIEKENKKVLSAVLETAKRQEDLSEKAFDRAKKTAMDSKSMAVQFAVIKKEADTNEEIFKILLTKSKELQLNTEIIGNNILMVVPPAYPVQPIKPKKRLNMMIGAMLGLVLGVLAAFAQERLDTSVQDSRDLDKINLPNLGMIPNYGHIKKIEDRNTKQIGQEDKDKGGEGKQLPTELIACTDPSSALSEAFSVVRTSLFLTTSCNVARNLMVTSATAGEGKSFIATALGSVIANYGQKVLLVEGDLRKPRVSVTFGEKFSRPGLSTLLTFGNIELDKCVTETEIPNLHLLSSGPLPKDPARLLHSDRMQSLMKELSEEFDLVLIDAPPVTGLPDARIMAASVDGVIFVVRQGHASIDVIKSARSILHKVGAGNILGAIFNNVGVSTSRYSNYGYGGYGAYNSYSQYYKYGYNKYYKSGGVKEA
jgi:polysaccharide biosynthesis transport protein